MEEIEREMASPDFWADKDRAQSLVREYQSLKEGGSGDNMDAGGATLAILAGAGGDDAEDFAAMLLAMYRATRGKGWSARELDANRERSRRLSQRADRNQRGAAPMAG
jgi:hypothetical protein